MEEILVVRAVDSDGTIFQATMAALHEKSDQTVDVSSSILSFGGVEFIQHFGMYRRLGKKFI